MKTLAGTGKPGLADGRLDRAQFDEPGGLSLAGRTLYVADTNNHAVRAIDLGRAVRFDARRSRCADAAQQRAGTAPTVDSRERMLTVPGYCRYEGHAAMAEEIR